MDLSIIIPFVGEYPQVLFTTQSIAQNMAGHDIDFEIIVVDNFCKQAVRQAEVSAIEYKKTFFRRNKKLRTKDIFDIHKNVYPTYENKSGEAMEVFAKYNTWLKYAKYEEKLSHWQAKRFGVGMSSGDVLMFVDAHVIPGAYSIPNMFQVYQNSYCEDGTMHLPLTYKILESRKLIYKLVIQNEAFYTYAFTKFRAENEPYEVPCMSTCGMMISRKIYDAIGGWPAGLGIYGGGENFMNYALAVCGYEKFIYPHGVLFHHGEKRDYHSLWEDTIKNRMIAHYLFGGEDLLNKFAAAENGEDQIIQRLLEEAKAESSEQRSRIKSIQEIDIESWAKKWKAK